MLTCLPSAPHYTPRCSIAFLITIRGARQRVLCVLRSSSPPSHLKAVHPVIGEVDDKSNTGALFVEGKDGSLTLLRDDQETVRDKQGRLRLKPSTKKSPGPLVHRIRSSKAPDHTGRLIPSRRYRIANKKFGTLQSRLQVGAPSSRVGLHGFCLISR